MLYPRIHTIEIPLEVKAKYIGLYASFKAAEFLMTQNIGAMNARTVTLSPHPTSGFIYVLRYESSAPIKLPSDEELYEDFTRLNYGMAQGTTESELEKEVLYVGGLDTEKPGIVEQPKEIPQGAKNRPSATNKSKGKRL